MTSSPRPRLMPPASSAPTPPRQLSMVFDSPVLQGMDPSERAIAVTQLAILLLQAAGVQRPGVADDDQ
ncbi:hypothetical protein [Thiomonas sp. X19]|uniref:hypothetical protein n=1 Tax=Thiomonas sp. X19 TaxID=1050370 RepID=UPI0011BF9505|nr:hypothetical protein [Thiomonas sp. X19]